MKLPGLSVTGQVSGHDLESRLHGTGFAVTHPSIASEEKKDGKDTTVRPLWSPTLQNAKGGAPSSVVRGEKTKGCATRPSVIPHFGYNPA